MENNDGILPTTTDAGTCKDFEISGLLFMYSVISRYSTARLVAALQELYMDYGIKDDDHPTAEPCTYLNVFIRPEDHIYINTIIYV